MFLVKSIKTLSDEKFIKIIFPAFPKLKLAEELFAVEGEKLEITCYVQGTVKKNEVSWKYRKFFFQLFYYLNFNHNLSGNSSSDESEEMEFDDDGPLNIDTEENNGVIISKLTKDKTELSDRGSYICEVNSESVPADKKGKFKLIGLLHVKDKFAALWPFLGICAEVFLLCAIILIYEKRRNKTEQEDSDTDQPDQ